MINAYPDFRALYEEAYEMCLNLEKVMGMYSKVLKELDSNTVQYMIDEMQETINRKDKQLNQKDALIDELRRQINELQAAQGK